jgi:hypothetical protein
MPVIEINPDRENNFWQRLSEFSAATRLAFFAFLLA